MNANVEHHNADRVHLSKFLEDCFAQMMPSIIDYESTQAFWARLLELLSIPFEVLFAGDADDAEDRSDQTRHLSRSDLNVTEAIPNLNSSLSTTDDSNPNITSTTTEIEASSSTPPIVMSPTPIVGDPSTTSPPDVLSTTTTEVPQTTAAVPSVDPEQSF